MGRTELNKGRMKLVGAMALATAMLIPMGAQSADELTQLLNLERQAAALELQVAALSDGLQSFAPVPPKAVGVADDTLIVAQSSRDTASINVRLGQVEEQIRVLTGQVEGLQFQMTQLHALLERMQEDTDARFSALEGGRLGKTDAVTQPGSETLTGELPQNQNQGTPTELPQDLTGGDTAIVIDPTAEDFSLGEPGQILGSLPADGLSGGLDSALDHSQDVGGLITDADANAQYQAGYDAVVRGDFEFAEDQFRQFIALFPDHPQAPDATNWLGDSLLQRGEFDEAADILLTGFQSYPNSPRAPDMLMKLGVALANAGEAETACRTFNEVLRRYPNVSPAFQNRLRDEAAQAQCS